MAKNDIEKMLEHLIMNESEEANKLFHDIIVNKSRSINESFTNDDVENANDIKDDIDEIENEMYYSDIELSESDDEAEEGSEDEQEEGDAPVDTKEKELEQRLSSHVDNDNEFKKKVFDLKSDMADLKAMFDKIIGSEEGLDDLDGEFETSDDVSADDVEIEGEEDDVKFEEGKSFRQGDDEDEDVKAKKREAWYKRKDRKAEPEELVEGYYGELDPDRDDSDIERAQEWCSQNFSLDEYLKRYGSDIQWDQRDSLQGSDKEYSSAELIDSVAHYLGKIYEEEADERTSHSVIDRVTRNLEPVATEIVRSDLQPKLKEAGYTITNALEESAVINEENQSDFDYTEVDVKMDANAQTGDGDEHVQVDSTSTALVTDIEDRQAGGPVEYAKSEPDAYGYHSIDVEVENDVVNNDDSSKDFYGSYFNKAVSAAKKDQLADVDTSAQLLPIPERK